MHGWLVTVHYYHDDWCLGILGFQAVGVSVGGVRLGGVSRGQRITGGGGVQERKGSLLASGEGAVGCTQPCCRAPCHWRFRILDYFEV